MIEIRQRDYDDHGLPIVEHFRTHAPDRFVRVNGDQPFDTVYAELRRVLQLDKK